MGSEIKRKIKVLHVITRLIIGGAQENTLLTVKGLLKNADYDVTLLTGPALGPEGSLIENAKDGINLQVLPQLRRNINPLLDLAAFIKIYFFLKKGNYDVVHTHSSKAGILARIAAKLAGVPVIIHTVHGLPFFKEQNKLLNFFYISAEKFTATFTDKIICVSPQLIKDALSVNMAGKEKFTVIYSGMELKDFVKNREERIKMRSKLGIPQNSPVIGNIARLFFFKGHEYLLLAAAIIKKQFPDIKILLIGDGILKNSLVHLSKKLELNNNVIFAGLIPPEKIPDYLQTVDILAHASLHEGLPRAVAQGFALEIPAVGFDIDGTRDIIKNGINGFLIGPKDITALSEKIIFLLKNREQAREMGENGKNFAMENFGAEKMVTQIDKLYRRFLKCGD